MQLLKSFAATATLLTLSANAAHIGKRQSQTCVEDEKYVGVGYNQVFSQPCANLANACFKAVDAGTTDIWSEKTCVAAATCDPKTVFVAQCQNSGVANATHIAHLDYNVYGSSLSLLYFLFSCSQYYMGETDTNCRCNFWIMATIVGDCAWADGGCPITSQNYIDLIYGALSDIESSSYPACAFLSFKFHSALQNNLSFAGTTRFGDEVVNQWWTPLTTWTATGDSVPYTNFDEWLHYAAYD